MNKQIEILLSADDLIELSRGLDNIDSGASDDASHHLDRRIAKAHAELMGGPICNCGTQMTQSPIGWGKFECHKCVWEE